MTYLIRRGASVMPTKILPAAFRDSTTEVRIVTNITLLIPEIKSVL